MSAIRSEAFIGLGRLQQRVDNSTGRGTGCGVAKQPVLAADDKWLNETLCAPAPHLGR